MTQDDVRFHIDVCLAMEALSTPVLQHARSSSTYPDGVVFDVLPSEE